ncbi:hypothetical protein ACJMK2_001115 [Sinanodonta woodiana]|uniref:DEAD/DEAH-box helicase domain-containing protein n=1 Tax=Sinanodonta woodiana TaxID=1069815 RepID=A0ABD3XRE8_SINWO
MADEEMKKAIANVLGLFNVDSLTLEQRKIIDALLEKKECIAVLPTGFGKSLPYQILVPIKRQLNINDGRKVIMCSPLVALMRAQS